MPFLKTVKFFLLPLLLSFGTAQLVKKTGDSLDDVPSGWIPQPMEDPHPDQPITLQIGLKQSNFASLVEQLYQISDPDHPRYGKHLSKEEVEALVRPHSSTVDLVNEWIESHGIDLTALSRSASADLITLTIPISVAEDLISSRYRTYRHTVSGRKVTRTLEYSLPRHLSDHIDFIQPTTYFGNGKRAGIPFKSTSRRKRSTISINRKGSNSDPCANIMSGQTPACLASLYKFADYVPKSTSRNKLGIVTYGPDFLANPELQTFFQMLKPEAVNTTYTNILMDGGRTRNTSGSEAALDIEYGMSLTFPTPVFVYTDGAQTIPPFIPNQDEPDNINTPWLEWAQFVLNETSPPQVFSTSYADTEKSIPFDYAQRVCNAFAQLAARGITLIFGSGDGGVDNDVRCDLMNTTTTPFAPSFPGVCPFVTSVGGTAGINPEGGVGGPISSNYRGSGAGFSNYFPQPPYQATAVKSYLNKLGATYDGLFNRSGRAFPDIAAQSDDFVIVDDEGVEAAWGTSASGPVVAAVVTLLNDYQLSRGRPVLGFLNPWLYSKGFQGLNDILIGQSEGCNGRGFNASKGWDPITGFGTPNFKKLQALLG